MTFDEIVEELIAAKEDYAEAWVMACKYSKKIEELKLELGRVLARETKGNDKYTEGEGEVVETETFSNEQVVEGEPEEEKEKELVRLDPGTNLYEVYSWIACKERPLAGIDKTARMISESTSIPEKTVSDYIGRLIRRKYIQINESGHVVHKSNFGLKAMDAYRSPSRKNFRQISLAINQIQQGLIFGTSTIQKLVGDKPGAATITRTINLLADKGYVEIVNRGRYKRIKDIPLSVQEL